MTMRTILSVILLCFLAVGNDAKPMTVRPIIGVLAQETGDKYTSNSYIIASYVKWAEAAGARVVPIKINEPDDYYETIFHRINGLLLPGGSIDIITSYHAKAAKKLYNMALRANDDGDYFPIWGTCQGFQLLSALTAGENLLADRPYNGVSSLDFLSAFRESRLFRNLPENVYSALANEETTSNLHMYGLTPTNFSRNSALKNFYREMSRNLDENGNVYISSMEAINYPFYGVQFHPEKNVYNWDLRFVNNHDAHAIQVAHYFADFFIAEARRSSHFFPTVDEEISAIINNDQPVYSEDTSFQDTYYYRFRGWWHKRQVTRIPQIATLLRHTSNGQRQQEPELSPSSGINERDEYYEDIFKRINGVLLPGGSVNVMTSYHAQAAKKLYKMALKANDEGDHFPIWGTCQGLQLLTALTAGENLLAYRPYNGPLPITFKHDFRNSRLFQNIPDNVRRALANENVTSNLHDYGLTPQNFSENCLLNTFYCVMSTNFDRNGKEYISSMEAVNYPFYGVQFHPEKNVYNWDLHFVNNHDAHAIQVAHYFADFFLAEARQSYHSFPTVNEEVRALIDNHQPVFSEDDTFQDIYYFNFRT
ncbi:gamma-glutamyl hydrolase-like [Ylistrum balloti]|uniref:gamma-glutamyl hydrolase-like n=1 Tax=Ylistrum balloti TaxID=509963 RepID=UPI002905C4AA|nr:gamma-glutamyl hydrolase-like [Ylistrum balloti]